MKKFKKYIEDQQLIKEEELILEFATIGPKSHKFGVDVKLHIMQPGDKKLQHAPRVKIIKKGVNGDMSIRIDNQEVIGDYTKFMTSKELKIIKSKIVHYKNAFLNFWNDPDMDSDEFLDMFSQIDRGFTIELVKNEDHHFHPEDYERELLEFQKHEEEKLKLCH